MDNDVFQIILLLFPGFMVLLAMDRIGGRNTLFIDYDRTVLGTILSIPVVCLNWVLIRCGVYYGLKSSPQSIEKLKECFTTPLPLLQYIIISAIVATFLGWFLASRNKLRIFWGNVEDIMKKSDQSKQKLVSSCWELCFMNSRPKLIDITTQSGNVVGFLRVASKNINELVIYKPDWLTDDAASELIESEHSVYVDTKGGVQIKIFDVDDLKELQKKYSRSE